MRVIFCTFAIFPCTIKATLLTVIELFKRIVAALFNKQIPTLVKVWMERASMVPPLQRLEVKSPINSVGESCTVSN